MLNDWTEFEPKTTLLENKHSTIQLTLVPDIKNNQPQNSSTVAAILKVNNIRLILDRAQFFIPKVEDFFKVKVVYIL